MTHNERTSTALTLLIIALCFGAIIWGPEMLPDAREDASSSQCIDCHECSR